MFSSLKSSQIFNRELILDPIQVMTVKEMQKVTLGAALGRGHWVQEMDMQVGNIMHINQDLIIIGHVILELIQCVLLTRLMVEGILE